jgi:hypothetical protein
VTIEEGRAVSKVLIKNLAVFFLFPSKQFLQISFKFSCGKLLPKTKKKAARGLIRWLPHKFRSLKI